jgi:hypothetical protein
VRAQRRCPARPFQPDGWLPACASAGGWNQPRYTVGADHHRVLLIWSGQQILQQIKGRWVEPLQIVEEECKRVAPESPAGQPLGHDQGARESYDRNRRGRLRQIMSRARRKVGRRSDEEIRALSLGEKARLLSTGLRHQR